MIDKILAVGQMQCMYLHFFPFSWIFVCVGFGSRIGILFLNFAFVLGLKHLLNAPINSIFHY